MLDLAQILLAQKSDDSPMRFLGILVIIGIFILGNVLQWWQKYQAQKRKEEQQRQAAAPPAPQAMQRPGSLKVSMPSLRAIARPTPGQAPRRTIAAQRIKTGQRAIPVVRKPIPSQPPLPTTHAATRRPAPPPAQPAPIETEAQSQSHLTQHRHAAGQDITASEIGSHAQVTITRANALQSLLKASSLRQIYVLTEVLQPPVGLRDSSTPEP